MGGDRTVRTIVFAARPDLTWRREAWLSAARHGAARQGQAWLGRSGQDKARQG